MRLLTLSIIFWDVKRNSLKLEWCFLLRKRIAMVSSVGILLNGCTCEFRNVYVCACLVVVLQLSLCQVLAFSLYYWRQKDMFRTESLSNMMHRAQVIVSKGCKRGIGSSRRISSWYLQHRTVTRFLIRRHRLKAWNWTRYAPEDCASWVFPKSSICHEAAQRHWKESGESGVSVVSCKPTQILKYSTSIGTVNPLEMSLTHWRSCSASLTVNLLLMPAPTAGTICMAPGPQWMSH